MISIDSDVAQTLDAYRVCEFATLARDGTPITWPTATRLQADGTFLITTSISFPQKAFNIRRDGRVALLFSDPTGSGLSDPAPVLLQGTAVCPEEVTGSPAGDEAYWTMLFDRQPSSRAYLEPPVRWLMDWYYMRLRITVTPTSITTLPAAQPAAISVAERPDLLGADQISRHPTAVLGANDDSGAPVLARVRAEAGPDGFVFSRPAGVSISEGPASLMVHEHDEHLANLTNVLVRGTLTELPDGTWALKPQRVVDPMPTGSVRDQLRLVRTGRAGAKGYLAKRRLSRPAVRWDLLKELVPN
ncbi:hypothetical protein JCM9957A_50950 [Kineosporia succinea]